MTMFCPDEEKLSAWVDRGLTPGDDEAVSTHLAQCEPCRRTVTLAFLVDRESPDALSEEGESRILQAVQGALAEPTRCVTDEQLAAWLHDGLAPAERAKVTDHMAECDDCRRVAALTRLSNTEPVSALAPDQEAKAQKIVLRSAGRDAFFSFWRVAAASVLVAIAATYVAIHWIGRNPVPSVPEVASSESANPPEADREGKGSDKLFVHSPKPSEGVKRPTPIPVKSTEPVIPIPARFQQLSLYDSNGLDVVTPGWLSYAQDLKPARVGWINVEGCALVVLDEGTEARVAFASDARAYVVELTKGRVYIDTVGTQQTWEIRRSDRSVTLRPFTGRASADVEGGGLRVEIFKGTADVGPHRLEEGRGVDVRSDSSVTLEERKAACAARADRYSRIRPNSLLVLRAVAGAKSDDGPWRYISQDRKARALEDGAALIPDSTDPIRWVEFELAQELKFTSDMVLHATCGGTGTRLYLWAGGWHGEASRSPGHGLWECSLRGLRRDMVDILAGEPFRKVMIGVVQERGREHTLEVDEIEIRRVLVD